jgi:hypothetical protein
LQLARHLEGTIVRRLGTYGLALPLLLGLATGGAARAGSIAESGYEWTFSEYRSDGSGGFTGPFEVDSGEQPADALDERFTLAPNGLDHLRVLATAGAAAFWSSARAPFSTSEDAGTVVGGRSELTVTLVFRKDVADATLRFSIEDSLLHLRDLRFDPARELRAIVHHRLDAGDFFSFDEEAVLDGYGGDWTFEEHGTGVLPYEIVAGAPDLASLIYAFSEPFERDIDLSAVSAGGEFTVTYQVIADAIDTSNANSLAIAAGFDGEHPTTGLSFEFTGLTPIGVPEPGGPLLLLTGAAMLRAARSRSARERLAVRRDGGSAGARPPRR